VTCPKACTLDLQPGETKTLRVSLRVAPDAWKIAPVGGSLLFTASAPGATPYSGSVGWGVVFPAGPPTPGLKLQVFDVQLSPQATAWARLKTQLTNTGKVPAGGTITVIAPSGVTFGTLPAGCRKVRATAAECEVTPVDTGKSWSVLVPLSVPARLRADAPLVGLVRAVLRPSGQADLQTQASYQIFAPSGQAGVMVGASAPAGSAGPDGLPLHDRAARFPLTKPFVVWPIIGGSVALLSVVIIGIVMTLRGRREEVLETAKTPRQGTDDDEEAEAPRPHGDVTAVISAGPVDRTPTPKGPISWEWRTGEEPTQPPPASADDDEPEVDLEADPDETDPEETGPDETVPDEVGDEARADGDGTPEPDEHASQPAPAGA
jgi:hypothetical protein